jgi:O-antigen ligase
MRTALIGFAIGVVVLSWRALRGRVKLAVLVPLGVVLIVSAFVVYQTRAREALFLKDPSSSLRVQVAKVGMQRIMLHPLFGHGMDAMHVHWNEWGFPGSDMLHLHSTPLQLAFDRGLPALFFWFWIVLLFWRTVSGNEKRLRETGDTNRYGILLGASGALAGFFASSLVNYNLGDGEVALVFWWLLGIVVVLSANGEPLRRPAAGH